MAAPGKESKMPRGRKSQKAEKAEKAGKAEDKGKPEKKARRGRQPGAPQLKSGSSEAKQRAAAVLEVLAGERLPSEAAAELGISVPCYYLLEIRALKAFLTGCEPAEQRKGRQINPDKKIQQLELENRRLKRDVARQQALLRVAQRTIGLSAARRTPAKGERRRRRPTVRALRAVHDLRVGLDRLDPGEREGKDGARAAT